MILLCVSDFVVCVSVILLFVSDFVVCVSVILLSVVVVCIKCYSDCCSMFV